MRVAFKAKISCSQWRNKGQGFGFERFSADPKLCLEVYQFFAYFLYFLNCNNTLPNIIHLII
jgi:hypothetical protein